jgi:hypothetical protein
VQHPAGAEQWVAGAAAVPAGVLLDAAAASVQRVTGQTSHVERVHHGDRVGQLLGGGGLEPGEPVHRDHLDLIAPGLGAFGEPGLERLFRASLDQSSSREGPVPSRIGVRSMITVTYLSPRRVWRHTCSSHQRPSPRRTGRDRR